MNELHILRQLSLVIDSLEKEEKNYYQNELDSLLNGVSDWELKRQIATLFNNLISRIGYNV